MAHEGVPLTVIQRQLGHSNLGITSVYLQGIDNAEIIDTCTGGEHPRFRSAPRSGSESALRTRAKKQRVPATDCWYSRTATL
jgi:hypothetical protein